MSESKHWASKQERGSYLGIQLLLSLYKYGGKWLILFFLAPILGYFFLTDKTARTASFNFLQRTYQYNSSLSPFKSLPGYWQSYCHFWQFALAALAKIDVWLGRITDQQIVQTGSVSFTDLIAQGKGGLLVASHLGNTEVCRALAKTKYKTRINVLVFTQHAAAFNKALKKVNQQMDMDLIQVSHFNPELTMLLKQRVEQGEFVVIVGDRISVTAPERAVWADFLGKKAPFAIGPWVLASVLECPVSLMFCIKTQGRYELSFEPFAEQISIPRKTRQQDLQQIAQDYATALAVKACQYPLQWFNFYDFWQMPVINQHKDQQE